MTAVVIVAVVVVVLVAAGVAAAVVARRRRRSRELQEQFGPEYERVLAESDSRPEAESTLAARKERRDQLRLRPLDASTRDRYRSDWREIQRSFLDDPGGAVEEADRLVTAIMRERGYPLEDVEQRAADISVDHPHVVQNYREARRVRDAHGAGAGTEDMRAAVASYRDLVEALLDEDGHTAGGGGDRPEPGRGVSGHGAGPDNDETAPDGRRDGSRR